MGKCISGEADINKNSPPASKILCLHGWRTNIEILQFQLSALRRSLEKDGQVDWHLLQSQRPASGPATPDILAFFGEGTYWEWYDFSSAPSSMNVRKEESTLEGAESSLRQIMSYIDKNGPFDAVLGFSQGSSVLGILTALYYSKKKQKSIPWRISIHVSGSLVRDTKYGPMLTSMATPIPQKSIFLIGEADYLTPRTVELAKIYEPSLQTIFTHKEGHKFPSPANFNYDQITSLLRESEQV